MSSKRILSIGSKSYWKDELKYIEALKRIEQQDKERKERYRLLFGEYIEPKFHIITGIENMKQFDRIFKEELEKQTNNDK